MLGLAKVLTLRKKKDEMMGCISEVQTHTKHIKPKNVLDKCGKAVVAVQRQGMDTLTDTTSSIGKGLCKTFRKQTNNASTFARDVKDCVDPEDMLKSIARRGKDDKANQKVIHKPIDWSIQSSRSFDCSHNNKDLLRSPECREPKRSLPNPSENRNYLTSPDCREPKRSLPEYNSKWQVQMTNGGPGQESCIRTKRSLVKHIALDHGDGDYYNESLSGDCRNSFQGQILLGKSGSKGNGVRRLSS